MERGVAASVLVVAVIKKARQLCRVSAHEQPRSGRRKCAQNRLEHLVVHAAGLVDDVEDVVSVESLQGVRLAGRSGHSEPLLGVLLHVDLFLCPHQLPLEGFIVAQPLAYLRPQDIKQLMLRRGRARDFGEWPG